MGMVAHNDVKHCPSCNRDKLLDDFHIDSRTKDKRQLYCKICKKKRSKLYYSDNKKELKSKRSSKGRTEEKRKYDREYFSKYSRRLKEEVFAHYGGKCECCSENGLDFLAIDHIDGDGWTKRKLGEHGSGKKMYAFLKKNGYPIGFRVLCHNCNFSAHLHNGICSHKIIDKHPSIL